MKSNSTQQLQKNKASVQQRSPMKNTTDPIHKNTGNHWDSEKNVFS